MGPEQLKQSISDLVALLEALDKLLPGKVDEELVAFLSSLDKHEWLVPLLHKSLELQLVADKRR